MTDEGDDGPAQTRDASSFDVDDHHDEAGDSVNANDSEHGDQYIRSPINETVIITHRHW